MDSHWLGTKESHWIENVESHWMKKVALKRIVFVFFISVVGATTSYTINI